MAVVGNVALHTTLSHTRITGYRPKLRHNAHSRTRAILNPPAIRLFLYLSFSAVLAYAGCGCRTAMHYAAASNGDEVIDALIENGAKRGITDNVGAVAVE